MTQRLTAKYFLQSISIFLCFCFSFHSAQLLEKARSVWVEQGLVKGKIYKIDDRHVQIFRGIPYAEPPIGDLRFKKPIKKSRWHQEMSAVEYGPPCLQFMDFHRHDRYARDNMKRESEDCLYLNVFSPYDMEDESNLYPILVWIHGGSFLAGSGDTGIDMETVAKNIVFKGVTLVTINYRLGPLGFINMYDGEKMEGNFGLWDMVMALQWIQANIKQFNGDPTRVTVMGESAGAAAASVLALSPKTTNLVHQAIIMSGSSVAGWALHRHGTPHWSVENMATYLRSVQFKNLFKALRRMHKCEKAISEEDAAEIVGEDYTKDEIKAKHCNYQDQHVDCLKNHDLKAGELLECMRKELNLTSSLLRKALAIELGVSKLVVDGDLIPAAGGDLLSNARIPIMTGVAKQEWAHKKPQFYSLPKNNILERKDVEQAVYRIIENSFHAGANDRLSNATLQLIANASFVRYLDDPSNTFETGRVVVALQNMEADIEFVSPCQREIDAYASKGLSVYAYSFDYVPESPIYEEEMKTFHLFGKDPIKIERKDGGERRLEAFHGLDHAYIFSRGYSSNFEIKPFTKKDETMSAMLTNMMTNFVKTGDPSTKRFTFPAFTNETGEYVAINVPPVVHKGDLHWPNPKFWNIEAELISKYVPREGDQLSVDPDADLTNEERVQLGAYRRAWWALWVLVIILAIVIWGIVAYCILRKQCSVRSKPYDNIVVPR